MTKQQQQMVLDNMGLIRLVLKNCNVYGNQYDLDDMFSVGCIGLCKAVLNLDPDKGSASSYMYSTIHNEICNHLASISRKSNEFLLLDAPMKSGSVSKQNFISIANTKPDDVFQKHTVAHIINFILNELEVRTCIIMLYRISHYSLREISSILDISHQRISYIEKQTQNTIKKALNKKLQHNQDFVFSFSDDSYIFKFHTDPKKFRQLISRLIPKQNPDTLPGLKINYKDSQAVLQLPADTDAFILIAQIVQELRNFEKFNHLQKKPIEKYNIVFETKDVSCFRNIFAKLITKYQPSQLDVDCTKTRAVLRGLATKTNIQFVSDIIKYVSCFSMHYVPIPESIDL